MAIPFRTAALAFALLLAACSGGGEAESTPAGSDGTPEASTAAPSAPDGASASDVDVSVTSDDGALTVTVPAGAGPADVTITAIDPPPEFADLEGASVIAAYELGPEGAEFSEPVALEFQAPLADSAEIPLLLPTISRTDGDGFELLEDLELIVGDSTVAIRGTTRHFSRLLIGGGPQNCPGSRFRQRS